MSKKKRDKLFDERFTLSVDEINRMESHWKYTEFYEFFDKMNISKKRKQQRVYDAELFFDLMVLYFLLFDEGMDDGEPDLVLLQMWLSHGYKQIAERKGKLYSALCGCGRDNEEQPRLPKENEFVSLKSSSFPEEIQGTTIKYIERAYMFSERRAVLIALNESLTLNMYYELLYAIYLGYTYKTWETIMDGKERDWHGEVDGMTIPIMSKFIVHGEELYGPGDPTASPDNVICCRCSLSFS